MLTLDQFRYLDNILRINPSVRPRVAPYAFADGHVPAHTKCQITAMHLETTRGLDAQIGIQWLDKGGLLFPWPHVINWVGDDLVDYSCPIPETKLVFTLTGNDVDMANQITASIEDSQTNEARTAWIDPLLSKLHSEWHRKLKRMALSR